MADEPTSLAAARAHKLGDSKAWTARDALVDTLRRLDAGEINPREIAIHWLQATGNEGFMEHQFCVAGMDWNGHIALLTIAQHETVSRIYR